MNKSRIYDITKLYTFLIQRPKSSSADKNNYILLLDGIEGCMRIYCTRHDDIHRARRGEYHHDSAVYSHTTRNKDILTLLRNTNYSPVHCLCVGLHWCKLTSLHCYRSRQDQTSLCWLTNSFLANYCCTYVTTIVKYLYIAWLSLYLISMNSSR